MSRPLSSSQGNWMNTPPHVDPHEADASSYLHARSDLKAQEDLLALKVLADPHFLERVPNLRPVEPLSAAHGHTEPSQADQAMKELSEEVQLRVFEAIERLLPELIASTMADVMHEWSQSDAPPPLDPRRGQ